MRKLKYLLSAALVGLLFCVSLVKASPGQDQIVPFFPDAGISMNDLIDYWEAEALVDGRDPTIAVLRELSLEELLEVDITTDPVGNSTATFTTSSFYMSYITDVLYAYVPDTLITVQPFNPTDSGGLNAGD